MKSLVSFIKEQKETYLSDMQKEDIIKFAKKVWDKACKEFDGKDFSKELCKEVGGHNFADDLFDLNYNDICITVNNDNGKCKVSDSIEMYDNKPNSSITWTFKADGSDFQER